MAKNLRPCNFITEVDGKEKSMSFDQMRQYLLDNPDLWSKMGLRSKAEVGKGQARIVGLPALSEEQLAGEREVEALKKGDKITTTHPIRLLKGIYGKRNPDGSIRSAHTGVNGVFSSIKEKIAERYMGDEGVVIFDIPAGVTVDTVQLYKTDDTKGEYGVSRFRPAETEAINNSDAQIVKLITFDSRGRENQYIVKDPELRKLAYKLEEGPQKGQASHRAYHGGPHAFGRFTTEKMGTGEGQQAFGWGLYFTDLEDVARWYASVLSNKNQDGNIITPNGGIWLPGRGPFGNLINRALRASDSDVAIKILKKGLANDELNLEADSNGKIKKVKELIGELENGDWDNTFNKKRNLYKVTLHEGKTPDEYTYLEWDKPLPKKIIDKVVEQAKKENLPIEKFTYPDGTEGISIKNRRVLAKNGKSLYEGIAFTMGLGLTPKETSLFLLRAGIDGIKYPAESIARGATSETARGFNYVVFDENAVTINERIQFRRAGFSGNPKNDTVLFSIGGEKLRESNYNVEAAINAVKEYLVSTGMTPENAEARINKTNLEQTLRRMALSNAAGGQESLSGIAKRLVPQDIINSVNISRRSTEEMLKIGKDRVDRGEIKPKEIVEEIASGDSRVLSPDEVAALVYYKHTIDTKLSDLYEKLNEAREKGKTEQAKDLKRQIKDLESDAINYEIASVKTAYEQSLAFRLRRMLTDATYSLVGMKTKYSAQFGYLPEDVAKRFEEYDKRLKEQEKREQELLKEIEEWEAKVAFENHKEQYEAERTNPKAIKPKVVATLQNWGRILAKPVASIFSKKGKGQARKAKDTSDGEVVYRDAVEMVMEYVTEKNDASDATVNSAIAKALKYIKSSKWYATLTEDEKAQADKEFTDTIKSNVTEPYAVGKNGIKIPDEVIKFYIEEEGLKDIDEVSEAILRDHKADMPDGTTAKDIRDAITQYGITRRPSQDTIKKTIREMKQIGLKRSQLEAIKNGMRPLKTGLIRDEKTDAVRSLEKEIREGLKKFGLEEVNPEAYLKTALERIKTALNNQIKDLDAEIKSIEEKIAAGEKVEGFKKSVKKIEYDAAAMGLKEQRDALKKVREDLLEKAGVNTQIKIDNAIRALENSIMEYERRLRDNDFSSFRSEETLPETEELKAAREKLKALRDEYNERKKALITPEMKEYNKLRELQDKLDDLIVKDAEGFYAGSIAARPQKAPESDAIKALRAQIAAMEQRLGIAESSDSKKIKRLQDKLREVLMGKDNKRGAQLGPDLPQVAQLKQEIQDAKDSMGKTFKEKEDAILKSKENAIKKIEREIAHIQRTGQRSPKAQKFNSAATEAMSQVVTGKRKALNEILKQTGIAEMERMEAAKKRDDLYIKELERRIREKDFSKPKRQPIDFDEEGKKIQREKRKIKDLYDYEFAKAQLETRTRAQKNWDTAVAIYNLPKSLLSGIDMSAPLRQGLPFLIAQLFSIPIKDRKFSLAEQKKAIKNLKFMFQSTYDVFSGIGSAKDFYENWLNDLKESENYQLMKDAKLYIAEESAKLKAGEELFANNLVHRIPILQGPLKLKGGVVIPGLGLATRSERAFNSFINYQRVQVFEQMAEVFKDAGLSEQQNMKDFKALAEVINTFTGRGNLGDYEATGKNLNKWFFSVKLVVSRLQMLNPAWYVKLYMESPKAAIFAMQQMAKFTTAMMSMIGMAALYLDNDDDDETYVDLDPRSPSFGTISLSKDIKVDITGGYSKVLGLFTRLLTGELIKPVTGEMVDMKPDDRWFVQIGKFLYGKAHPTVRAVTAPLFTSVNKEGDRVTAYGELYDVSEDFAELIFPLVLQDAYKITDKEGAATAAALIAAAFFGASVSVKSERHKTAREQSREVILGETFESKQQDKKLDVQLKEGNPELMEKRMNKYAEDKVDERINGLMKAAGMDEKLRQREIANANEFLKLEYADAKFAQMTQDKIGPDYLPATEKYTSKEFLDAFFRMMAGEAMFDPIPNRLPPNLIQATLDYQAGIEDTLNKLTPRTREVIMNMYAKQAEERKKTAETFNKLKLTRNGSEIDWEEEYPNGDNNDNWYALYKKYNPVGGQKKIELE